MSRARFFASVSLVMLMACAVAFSFADAAQAQAKVAVRSEIHAAYDYYATGNVDSKSVAKTQSGLMLMGGGDNVDPAFRWLLKDSGGGHVVVLRASGSDNLHQYLFADLGHIASVETLVFHDRAAASDARVLQVLSHADGIFIAGGDQSNYVRFWKDTPVSAALDAHVRGGKPLGGTSAGLAMLGHYLYGAMDGESLESKTALADPFSSQVTLVKDFLHLPWLDHVITDSHFNKRARQGRLAVFVSRLRAEEHSDKIVGIGIDENTALCIDAGGAARVFSGSGGSAWLFAPTSVAQGMLAGKPLGHADFSVTGIGENSSIDMRTLQVSNPSFVRAATIADGVLTIK